MLSRVLVLITAVTASPHSPVDLALAPSNYGNFGFVFSGPRGDGFGLVGGIPRGIPGHPHGPAIGGFPSPGPSAFYGAHRPYVYGYDGVPPGLGHTEYLYSPQLEHPGLGVGHIGGPYGPLGGGIPPHGPMGGFPPGGISHGPMGGFPAGGISHGPMGGFPAGGIPPHGPVGGFPQSSFLGGHGFAQQPHLGGPVLGPQAPVASAQLMPGDLGTIGSPLSLGGLWGGGSANALGGGSISQGVVNSQNTAFSNLGSAFSNSQTSGTGAGANIFSVATSNSG